MFNSPLAWCPVARTYVALDEPVQACAAQNRCGTGDCPLKSLFKHAAAATDGGEGMPGAAEAERHKDR